MRYRYRCKTCHVTVASLRDWERHVDEAHLVKTPWVSECGTEGGYQRHRKSGEDACDRCKEAHRVYTREWQRQWRRGYGNGPEWIRR